MKAARFTADEIERVAYLTTKGYLPVAVDVASMALTRSDLNHKRVEAGFNKF